MALARASGLLLALVVCAWFALGIRQAHDTDQATAIVSGQGALSPKQAAHTGLLLRAAGMLNPDAQVDVLRGRLALLENDRPRAARIFEHVVRRKPMNAAAWLLLLESADDARTFRLAVANFARLDPTVSPAR